ncbi:MAG: nitroreductase family deazaflavin-dependent oxidoreductase [Candidatus Geothermarchaeales archaeon]
MTTMSEWNARVVEEFRANGGKVGGPFEGAPLVLLSTIGARTGQRRTTPLMCLPEGDRLYVFASRGGAPSNPGWYHNLVAHSAVRVEFGTETFEAEARVLSGEERDHIDALQAEPYPQFAEYQRRTTRKIPVVVLMRR